jgi:hypothetical protein
MTVMRPLQTVEIDLSYSVGVNIVGCNLSMLEPMGLTESNAADLLLPSTKGALLRYGTLTLSRPTPAPRRGEARGFAGVTTFHPHNPGISEACT